MKFYNRKKLPKRYHNQIFIAEHGSWNRNPRIGYRITAVLLDTDSATPLAYQPFVTGTCLPVTRHACVPADCETLTRCSGWLAQDQTRYGRPVDILVLPDGSLLISDDSSNTVFRVH